MKKLIACFLGGLALVASLSLALGQVNVVPQTGVFSGVVTKATYSSVALATPIAASATDIACITGSATKTIKVTKIEVNGTAATLISIPVTLLKRTTADTAGTAGTTTANWANNISKADSAFPTASATLISYSANPTINDTSPTYIRSAYVTLPVTTAATSIAPIKWGFGDTLSNQAAPLVLKGAAEQLCLNLNATSPSTGLLHASIEWTEE